MDTLKLAVVGHTNTGKTSLMRTLLRDTYFGEVKNAAATTRHVEEAIIGEFVHLYDTPGLEDAGGILDWLEAETSHKLDGIERLNLFLASPAAKYEFSQEAKVLRQLLQSDCALYVIDAREPVLPKYKDELTILSWCAKPIMPVFNFTMNQDLSEWQTMLARRTLHVCSSFDTVAFDFAGEIRLWENLASMISARHILDSLIQHRRHEWQHLDKEARLLIAHFLLNIAAFRQTFDSDTELAKKQEQMQITVRQAERQLHKQLLNLYKFYNSEWCENNSIIQSFSQDPFDSDLLRHYGIRTGKGLATGAVVGLGIDALTLGTSLGLGTAIGSLLGGVLSNWETLSDKITGTQTLLIDPSTLIVLATRARELLNQLQARGHASQDNFAITGKLALWSVDKLPEELIRARHEKNWSSFNGENTTNTSVKRASAAHSLAEKL